MLPPTLIAQSAAGSTNSSSVTTSGINTTGATLLLAAVSSYTGLAAVTDSLGNIWQTSKNTTVAASLVVYYCANPKTGASHTFTATCLSGASSPAIAVQAFGGVDTLLAQPTLVSGSGVTSIQGAIVTPIFPNCFVVSAVSHFQTATTINMSFAAETVNGSSGSCCAVGLAYLIQTTATAENPTWSWTGSSGSASTINIVFGSSANITGTPTTIPGGSAPFDPTAINFTPKSRQRYYQRMSSVGQINTSLNPAFDYSVYQDVLWTRTSFGSALSSSWTTTGGVGAYQVTFGSGTLSGYRHVFDRGVVAPYACVQAAINSSGTAGTSNAALVGLFQPGGNVYLAAKYDAKAQVVSLVYNTGSGETTIASYSLGSAAAQGSILDFALSGSCASVFFAGTFILAVNVSSYFETRDLTIITAFRFGFALEGNGSGNTMSVTGTIGTGYFGGIGATDYRIVRDSYGNIYQDANGLVYFTADLTGWAASASSVANDATNFNTTAHIALFSLDPRNGAIVEVGKIFPQLANNVFTNVVFTNTPPGGTNCVGCISDASLVWDAGLNQFVLTVLTASAYYLIYYGLLPAGTPLAGIVAYPQMSPLPLSTDANHYAGLNATQWRDSSGTWNVAYVEAGVGHPLLYRGRSLTSLALVASDLTTAYLEGATMVRIAGKQYVMFTGQVYDPTNGALAALGTLNLNPPPNTAGSGASPWLTLFPYQQNGVTEFYALLFQNNDNAQTYIIEGDGTAGAGKIVPFTSGTFCLYKGDHTLPYYQSPLTGAGAGVGAGISSIGMVGVEQL
jgi:hypothetical protein